MVTTTFSEETQQEMRDFYRALNEKDRRRYAGLEAKRLGHGGISYIRGCQGGTHHCRGASPSDRRRSEVAVRQSGVSPVAPPVAPTPTVRDRVVQTALVHVIEPILDATFHERSFGFRHGRGCHDALRCVEELLEAGYVYVVDADLKSYFDSIPKDRLLEIVQQKISDRRVLELVKMFLNQGIMEDMREWIPEAGVPQDAVLSPVLSNAYLNPLDHRMAERGFQMVRYADDLPTLRSPKRSIFEPLKDAIDIGVGWFRDDDCEHHASLREG